MVAWLGVALLLILPNSIVSCTVHNTSTITRDDTVYAVYI